MFKGIVNWARKKSPWIIHVPCGGCNGCDIEIVAALSPYYDVERFGILQKGSPRHADILLVTGPVTFQIKDRLKRMYDLAPDPKMVVAVGNCAISGEMFDQSYAMAGPLDKILPVSVYIPGCPPKPEAIIHGIAKALKIISSKA
ncbi:MAG: NADH-quinone oxidoreductase subunit B family protein [Candidatus Bathyarchaeia archaeon]